MKKTLLAAGAVLALSSSFTVNAAENDKPQYLSDWWHQSVNVVEAITPVSDRRSAMIPTLSTKHSLKKTGSTSMVMRMRRYSSAVTPMPKGIWNHGSPLFMEIEPRFSIDKLTNTDLSFGPFKGVVLREQLHLRHGS
ncbi:nucleoside-specific channel-forming protein tsx [Escherichia coli]|uniref:Nucleoside-specific channel-forming protein Tsx n=1 Tax=Escherichia coli TaxID=562 RepID=A0A2X3KE52_ECOLX|nr:nucleoside-specific channel-forming protein tsx [Escherichia coli]